MTRKRRRLIVVVVGLAMLGAATGLILSAMGDSLVFFYSPSDLAAQTVPAGRHVRIGGLVEDGSVERAGDGKTVHFKITDGKHDLPVTYVGALPDLFREGQGVVAEGTLADGQGLAAKTVLARIHLQQSGVSLSGDVDLTLEHLLEQAKTDETARVNLLEMLDALGPQDPRYVTFRRRLANYIY